jgi:hypothetical protein
MPVQHVLLTVVNKVAAAAGLSAASVYPESLFVNLPPKE